MNFLTKNEALEDLTRYCNVDREALRSVATEASDALDSTLVLGEQCCRFFALARKLGEWIAPFSICIHLPIDYGI